MNRTLAISLVLMGALLAGGCATKKYVQETAAPIQTKVDQVAQQANTQGTQIDASRKDIERHETGINAARERAMSAENRANEAMTKASEVGQTATEAKNLANQNTQAISSLKDSLGNLDDYKLNSETVVNFGFNKDKLADDARGQIDQFVKQHANAKRYFITIEGFADKTGSARYNDELSRRRADSVMAYLVTQYDIPVYRIQEIGLGTAKPADTGRNRTARAKNRRVEVKMFVAPDMGTSSQAQNTQPAPSSITQSSEVQK